MPDFVSGVLKAFRFFHFKLYNVLITIITFKIYPMKVNYFFKVLILFVLAGSSFAFANGIKDTKVVLNTASAPNTMVSTEATVQTDLLDYPPGATAYITGSGFTPGEWVTLQVLHVGEGDDLTSPTGAHAPWDVKADASGNISSEWLVPLDEDELGATLLLTADGQISLLHAEWTFTDALDKHNIYLRN